MDGPKTCPAREVVIAEHVDRSGIRHLRDVGAGREGPVITGQDHAADGIVAVERFQRVNQLRDRLLVQRVADLRPVDRNDANRALHLGEHELVRHRSLLAGQV